RRAGAWARGGTHLGGVPADGPGGAVRGGGGGAAGDASRHRLQGQEQGPEDVAGDRPATGRRGAVMSSCPPPCGRRLIELADRPVGPVWNLPSAGKFQTGPTGPADASSIWMTALERSAWSRENRALSPSKWPIGGTWRTAPPSQPAPRSP